jgi:hypothetical protein
MRPHLVRWQWEGYPTFHTTKLNLAIHIIAVPAFVANLVALLFALATMHWISALESLLGMVVSFAVQGFGHKREPQPAIPFDGPVDAISRIFVEQLITFPRFVFSGRWLAALKKA